MTIYITPDNKLHDDANGFALTLPSWPKDAREATPAEIEAINNPAKPLDVAKAELRTKVNDKRNELEVGGFPYMGKVFDSDPRSFYRITTANDAALKDPSFSIEWTVADNTKLAMNAQEMLGVMPALAGYGQLIFNNSVALKKLIDEAESVEQLNDPEYVDIDSGWPTLDI
jgi:hypothetical protein